MAVTVTNLESRRRGCGTATKKAAGGPTVRAAIDAFLDTPNTLRAYAGVLDRVADQLDAEHALADIADAEIGDALTELWGDAKRGAGKNGAMNRKRGCCCWSEH